MFQSIPIIKKARLPLRAFFFFSFLSHLVSQISDVNLSSLSACEEQADQIQITAEKSLLFTHPADMKQH